MVALADIQLRKHLTVMQVVDEVLLLLVIGHRLRFMDLFGILMSMLDLILWDSYSSFFTSVNKYFGGEHQVIASPSGTLKIFVFAQFLASPLSFCLYFLPGSSPSLGINRCIRSVLPIFQFLAALFLRLLPSLAGLPWFLVEHVVS